MSSFLVAEFPNGVLYPATGIGSSRMDESALAAALAMGYRAIDTAFIYNNEASCGRQVNGLKDKLLDKLERQAPVPTRDFRAVSESEFIENFAIPHGPVKDDRRVFVTGKVWFDHFTDAGIDETLTHHLKCFGRETADMLLLHWPAAFRQPEASQSENQSTRFACWRKLEKLYHDKKIRAIGVSNYMYSHLKPLVDDIEKRRADGDELATLPMANEFEISPYCRPDRDLLELCRIHRILPIAYSPLFGRHRSTEMLSEPALVEVSASKNINVGPVVLRWILQQGFAVIPKSNNASRLASNLLCETLELSDAEMETINSGVAHRDRHCDDPHLIP